MKQQKTVVTPGNNSHSINPQHKIPQTFVLLLSNAAWIQRLVLLLQALLEKISIKTQ